MATLTYYDCQFHIGQEIYLSDSYFGTLQGVDRSGDGELILYNGNFVFKVPILPSMKFLLRPFDSLLDEELLFIGKIIDDTVKWTIERTTETSEFNGVIMRGSTAIDYLKISFDTETISTYIGNQFFRLHSSVEKYINKYLLLMGFDVFELEEKELAFYEI